MKLEVKYLFPTLSSDSNLYIYQLPEGLAMRQILAHAIKMQKNPETRWHIFWIFMELYWSKSLLATPMEISSIMLLTPKLSITHPYRLLTSQYMRFVNAAWHIPSLMLYSTISNISASVNNFSSTPAFFKHACHSHLGADRKWAGSSL